MEALTAKISGVFFSNKPTGFHVLKVVLDGTSTSVTVKGSYPGVPVAVGLKAKFTGQYVDDPKYGRQFAAVTCEITPEKGRSGIVAYLSSNVPSIGPITAAKMYDALGDDLVRVLDSDPDKIRELPFLSRAQVDAILKEWAEASESRTVAIFLTDLGLTSSQVKSAFTRFGMQTKEVVRQDPYRLYECPGVGFSAADQAARKMGVGVDDLRRVKAMVLFSLEEQSSGEGHMYSTTPATLEYISRRIFRRHSVEAFSHGEYMTDMQFYAALSELKEAEDVVQVDERIYLVDNWIHETRAAESVADLCKNDPRELGDLDAILAAFESTRGIQLSDEQRQAFLMLKKSRACVVSGYPGTGKTTLVSAFVHLFEQSNLNYSLLSPTGIAAKRLSQVTGKPASTIHRALGYDRDGEWGFNSSNKFVVDAVIVDEMSMVDGSTFFHLVTALPSTTIVIMVGDSAQLPSVGAGYVLNNLMQCNSVPHVALTRVYRQAKTSDIIEVAHSMLRGDQIDTRFNKDSEFVFISLPKDDVVDEVCKLSSLLKSKEKNFQVIIPVYDGDLGINSFNRSLRSVLNPDFSTGRASKLKHGDVDFYEGDRVMVIKNDYDRMTFNGDVGKIQRISLKSDEVEVKIFDWFDQESPVPRYVDKIFTYKVEEARHVLKVAYACSVHRCQGQEFDYVILPMTMQYGIMLYRNLVYTAITRAKKKVFVFGDPRAFALAVSSIRETVRNSHLKELIPELLVPPPAAESQERLKSAPPSEAEASEA